MSCPLGCENNECKECVRDSDCAKWGGAVNSTCQNGKCVTETCESESGFIHLGHDTESCCVRFIPFAGNAYVTEAEGTLVSQAMPSNCPSTAFSMV